MANVRLGSKADIQRADARLLNNACSASRWISASGHRQSIALSNPLPNRIGGFFSGILLPEVTRV